MFTCSYSISQQVSLFQNITTANGLPSNYVFDMVEDANGFFWAGTDKGLAKFDGYRWQLFTIEDGLPGNYVGTVMKAGNNGLWLGISTRGLYHYTISTGKVTFVSKDFLHHYLQTDTAGNLFFFISGGTNKKFEAKWVSHTEPGKTNTIFSYLPQPSFKSLMVNFEKKELLFYKSNSAQTIEPDITLPSKNWKKVYILSTIPTAGLLKNVTSFLYNDMHSMYVTSSSGFVKEIAVYDTSNSYFNSLRYQNQTVAWDEKTGLRFISDEGNIKSFTEKDGLTNLLVTDVHIAKNGNLLISTVGGGIYYMLPNGNAVVHTNDKPVKGVAQQGNTIYAVTADKLLQYDVVSGLCKSFPIKESSVQAADVWGNDIFISSLTGFSIYQISGNNLIKKKEIKRGAGICNVIQSGEKYFAGSYGNHVVEYNNNKSNTYELSNSPLVSERLQAISTGYVSYNYEDGISFLSGNNLQQQLSVKDGLPSNTIYNVHERNDTFWISTAKGVSVFAKGKWVKNYTAADGINGGKCKFSFHDKSGSYFVVSDKCLNVFNGKYFSTISSAAIVQDKFDNVTHCIYNKETNSLVAGSLHNFFIVRLDKLTSSTTIVNTALKSISADGRQIDKPENFNLPANYNSLQFQFLPVDANPFSLPVIYYKLEGYQPNFITLKDSTVVSFSKLQSGHYRLIAKTMDANGIMSEEKQLASFQVKPPFVQSALFIFLTSLALSGLVAGLVYYYQKRKRVKLLRERQLEESLNAERERISKDLHDHLGTAIVTMIAQTDNIEAKLMNNNHPGALEKVKELSEQSRETVNVLRETIWAVQENSHTLGEFILRTKNFLQRVLPQKNIDWVVTADNGLPLSLTANQSLQLFRIIQECTQNIIKHSNATEAVYTFKASSNQLTIQICDNGKGIDKEISQQGNGFKNMEQRVHNIGGSFTCINKTPSGVETIITLPIEKTR
ncbi:MAG: two-component regulator propeller domain-containing protein [Ferruginibacter sp.]